MTVDRGVLRYGAAPVTSRLAADTTLAWRALTAGLILADAAAVGVAFALAYLIRFRAGLPLLETPEHTLAFYSWVTVWAVPVWLVIFGLYGLYDRHHLFAGFGEYTRVVNASTIGLLFVVWMSFIDVTLLISRGWLLMTWLFSFLLVCASRFAIRRLLRQLRQRGLFVTSAVIVGTNEEARALAEQLGADAGSGARLIGLVDTASGPTVANESGLPILGDLSDLRTIVDAGQVGEIIVAPTALSRNELLELYRLFGHDRAVELRFSSGLFEILTTGIRVKETSSVPLVTPQRVRITGVDALLKAALDYAVALTALTALGALLFVIALLVKLDSDGPILHRRRVLGRSGKPFDAFKFRTMVVDADRVLERDPELKAAFEKGYKLKRDPRVTRVGAFLRRTSLDELPQLLNVLRGEMSLVGPRMIAPDEAARYGKWQLNLLTVKPGITGPWQVRGRSDIAYDERIRLSMHYIRNYSIWLDLEILLRTLPAVVHGTGAY
jgi:exopolysaccharide biosynthesis polyprenyl glycosylphosphotransferase